MTMAFLKMTMAFLKMTIGILRNDNIAMAFLIMTAMAILRKGKPVKPYKFNNSSICQISFFANIALEMFF